MNDLITTSTAPLPVPAPKVNINIRLATMDDFTWMDALQKKHNKMLGFQTKGAFEGKIKLEQIIVAEAVAKDEDRRMKDENDASDSFHPSSFTLHPSPARPVGYCMGGDRYLKRDELGVIYQMNIEPEYQRSFVGAALLKAMFERSAYGCKLYCCWCAQDIAANRFWESMGFTAIAFRTGSEDKGPDGGPRTHIFWQKRIREGDTSTPYWYPCKTDGGSMGDERLVLPIPPGTHWSDAKPVILPGMELMNKALPKPETTPKVRTPRAKKEPAPLVEKRTACQISKSRLSFTPAKVEELQVQIPMEKKKREKKPRAKFDPKLVAKARELRDRYLEEYNDPINALESSGKYNLTRQLAMKNNRQSPLLLQAA